MITPQKDFNQSINQTRLFNQSIKQDCLINQSIKTVYVLTGDK